MEKTETVVRVEGGVTRQSLSQVVGKFVEGMV
jgi:hypothetical protein